MLDRSIITALTIAATSTGALAGIATYTSDMSRIFDDTHNANFDQLNDSDNLFQYQEGGIQVSVDRDYYSWNAPGFNGSEMFYASTGSLELVEITLTDSEYFGDIDMEISSGWSASTADVMYLWIQLFDGDSLVQEIDLNAMTGDYVGIDMNTDLIGGGIDRIMIGSYASEELRDGHNPTERNAIAIDNISVGTYVPVPAPGTLAISGIALLGLRRRR